VGNIFYFCVCLWLAYKLFLFFYFRSNKFIALKASIDNHIDDCNQLNNHIEELKNSHDGIASYDYGTASKLNKLTEINNKGF
jgi:hypothetical protein